MTAAVCDTLSIPVEAGTCVKVAKVEVGGAEWGNTWSGAPWVILHFEIWRSPTSPIGARRLRIRLPWAQGQTLLKQLTEAMNEPLSGRRDTKHA